MRRAWVRAGFGLLLGLALAAAGGVHAQADWPYSGTYVPPSWTPAGWPSYSYYGGPAGFPARIYVGAGTLNDFPFLGQPYGHAYDRYGWGAMSGGANSALNRYYYPPLR
jgi:hypothetical protein